MRNIIRQELYTNRHHDRLDAISSSAADSESTPEKFISPIASRLIIVVNLVD